MVMEKHVPERYKKTEVGVIPEDWKVVRLADVDRCEIVDGDRGKNYPSSSELRSSGYCLFLNAGNVTTNGFQFNDCEFISKERDALLSKGKLFPNDIVLTTRGTIGNIAFFNNTVPYSNLRINSGMVLIRNNNTSIHKNYLFMILKSSIVKKQILQASFGSAQPQLTVRGIGSLKIILPKEKIEQQAIATALSDVDNLITSLEQLIEKKKAIKQGTMQELLTGRRRLEGFGEGKGYKQTELGLIPEDWDIKKILSFATMKARIGWQGLTTEEYKDNGDFYLITGTDFDNGRVDWQNCHFVEYNRYKQDVNIQVESNDILVTKDGTIGKIAYVEKTQKKATLNSGIFLIRIKNDSTHSRFLFYLLNSKYFTNFLNKLTAGSTINHLYQKDFISFSVPIPINIDEQIAISVILFDMDAEIEILETKVDKYKQIKQGMMQNLLSGRIRLK